MIAKTRNESSEIESWASKAMASTEVEARFGRLAPAGRTAFGEARPTGVGADLRFRLNNDLCAYGAADGNGSRSDGEAVRGALLCAAVMRAIGMVVAGCKAGPGGAVMRHFVATRLGGLRFRQATGVVGGEVP